ncbi:hypothetical protein HDU89_006267 [Geranomyces variabilis]|nr:hypothetical protein HDU89_006267 [Geranomyces variabilis]
MDDYDLAEAYELAMEEGPAHTETGLPAPEGELQELNWRKKSDTHRSQRVEDASPPTSSTSRAARSPIKHLVPDIRRVMDEFSIDGLKLKVAGRDIRLNSEPREEDLNNAETDTQTPLSS